MIIIILYAIIEPFYYDIITLTVAVGVGRGGLHSRGLSHRTGVTVEHSRLVLIEAHPTGITPSSGMIVPWVTNGCQKKQ